MSELDIHRLRSFSEQAVRAAQVQIAYLSGFNTADVTSMFELSMQHLSSEHLKSDDPLLELVNRVDEDALPLMYGKLQPLCFVTHILSGAFYTRTTHEERLIDILGFSSSLHSRFLAGEIAEAVMLCKIAHEVGHSVHKEDMYFDTQSAKYLREHFADGFAAKLYGREAVENMLVFAHQGEDPDTPDEEHPSLNARITYLREHADYKGIVRL